MYAGKGSRQIRSVTLEKGLAQRVTGDLIRCGEFDYEWAVLVRRAALITPDALDLLLTLN